MISNFPFSLPANEDLHKYNRSEHLRPGPPLCSLRQSPKDRMARSTIATFLVGVQSDLHEDMSALSPPPVKCGCGSTTRSDA